MYDDRWSQSSIAVRHDFGRVFHCGPRMKPQSIRQLVAVGGDYANPETTEGTAAACFRDPEEFVGVSSVGPRSQTPPHGFRSAVAYDADAKTWITVGPNGTDISTDDGRNWRALHPDPASHEPPDADRNWNALSLPFVVGPHGRIGKLNPHALKPAAR